MGYNGKNHFKYLREEPKLAPEHLPRLGVPIGDDSAAQPASRAGIRRSSSPFHGTGRVQMNRVGTLRTATKQRREGGLEERHIPLLPGVLGRAARSRGPGRESRHGDQRNGNLLDCALSMQCQGAARILGSGMGRRKSLLLASAERNCSVNATPEIHNRKTGDGIDAWYRSKRPDLMRCPVPRKLPHVPDLRNDAFGADVEALAARAFGRAAGAQPTEGNTVGLLLDARENFPAWLDAIRGAQRMILFECYILDDDEIGREFASALADRVRDGVQVYVLYDWFGSFRARHFWNRLRDAGVRVAAFNPPQFGSPLGLAMRDHRKMIAIDGRLGFVSGLCVSGRWLGIPQKRLEPWRDTGVQIQGPAVADLEQAFEEVWRATGAEPLSRHLLTSPQAMQAVGSIRVRVVSGEPGSASTYRLDLLIAALAHERLWLTDAYFVGTTAYVQALRAAAHDGVDVRLLVPGASDIPAVSMLSRAGYRALLDAGIRVFEWNGTMLHAKTAVADLHWSRIGSTNLNLASLLGNYELDVAIEDPAFAARMAEQFELDLACSTEIVLTPRNRVRRAEPRPQTPRRSRAGSAGRAAAGAISVGSALGAALTNRRALGPSEIGLLAKMAVVAIGLSVVGAVWPEVIAWPAAAVAAWIGLSWMSKAWTLKRGGEHRELARVDEDGVASSAQPPNAAPEPAAVAPAADKPERGSKAEVGADRH